jgi:DNA-binding response OmpR family regulator
MPRILIIEDDADSQRALAIRLRASGFEVVTASDGSAAVAVARRDGPDLVVLDLGLPAGDGFLVMERLRALPATAAVPIIVLTGRDPVVHEARALAAGAVAFFQKPAENAALLSAIRAHLPAPIRNDGALSVLVVEDDTETLRAMCVRLRHQGFEVTTAVDGATALIVALRERPDIVLLDLGLPGGGGLAVLQRLRLRAELAGIPVLVVTARADAAAKADALAAGAHGFLTKPVDPQVLIQAIRDAVTPA